MSEHPTHTPGVADSDDPKALTTVIVGSVGVVITFALVVALAALHHKTAASEFERKVVLQEPEELRQVQAEHIEQLNRYRWVDRENEVVAIPVDRAMELLVEEARSGYGGR